MDTDQRAAEDLRHLKITLFLLRTIVFFPLFGVLYGGLFALYAAMHQTRLSYQSQADHEFNITVLFLICPVIFFVIGFLIALLTAWPLWRFSRKELLGYLATPVFFVGLPATFFLSTVFPPMSLFTGFIVYFIGYRLLFDKRKKDPKKPVS